MTPTQRITVYKMTDGTFRAVANIVGFHWCTYECDHTGKRLKPERDDIVHDNQKKANESLKGLVTV